MTVTICILLTNCDVRNCVEDVPRCGAVCVCGLCCVAAVGRRGWKMFYAALCDMTLYMYSDENSYRRSTHCANVIHLHHSLAAKAGDYVKKNHVFRLHTADMAQYLVQTRFSSFPEPSARHRFTLPDHIYGASASRSVPVCVTAFAGTHCA